ncbi:MAG TPA: hypothetical protein C5S37_11150 [Methanophagales archaeon]|nr:hypothetical protein [Methanophagales archaeon]
MKKKNEPKIWIAMAAFMAVISLSVFVGSASADIIYVPTDYPTIQEAIDAASPGDTVFVWNGSYYEDGGVNITKDRITLQGEDANTTTIHGMWTAEMVVYVTGNYVNFSGFTVAGSTEDGYGIYVTTGDNCIISDNFIIEGNYGYGIYLNNSANSTVSHNNASKHDFGICLSSSNNCLISDNIANSNRNQGIKLVFSSNCTLKNNIANSNGWSIYLYFSSNCTVINNIANSNGDGIFLSASRNCTIIGNIVNLNLYEGIALIGDSSKCTISNNIANSNRYGIWLHSSSNNTLINNTVNSNDCGIWLSWHSNNTTLTSNIANSNDCGIYFSGSSNNTITKNIAGSNRDYGICLESTSTNNTITNNNITNNNHGMYLDYSGNNEIYHNNFINNDKQAYDHRGFNKWDKGPIIGGNYWSDHVCHGNPSNGTEPYTKIDTDAGAVDNYPFQDPNGWFGGNKLPIASFTYSPRNPVVNETITFNASSSYDPDGNITNYEWDFGDGNNTNTTEPIITHSYVSAVTYNINLTVTDDGGAANSSSKLITVYELEENIFDTGSPINPYPSIMGNHTGTIKPNQTVIATKLYTYPCAGTGEHTEYAEIRNATWNATATWEGYVGDWKNITFDKTVVLLANKTYNYTIRTGSYPQIHHKFELPTENGWINCTKFTDANGRIYTDWIPAIRLE